MGVMNKMRESTSYVLYLLVFAFGIIWVIQDSGYFDTKAQQSTINIAEVNGQEIKYQDFSQALDGQMRAYQQQTGESVPPQMIDLFRDQVYDRMVEDVLREEAMKEMGINISDAELVDLVMGDNPDPFVAQQFSDGQGGVNRQLLMSYVENVDLRDQWLGLEDYLRSKRLNEKLDKLLQATVRVSDAEIEEQHMLTNLKADAQYVALRYADIPDSLVNVDTRAIRTFYAENKEDFKRERSYDVAYTLFSKEPTAADTTRIIGDLEQQRDLLANTQDDSSFVSGSGSVRPFTSAYLQPGDLDADLASAIFEDLTPGKVIGPILSTNQYHLVKILDTQASEEPAINARHILFGVTEDAPQAEQDEKRQLAREVLAQIRAGEDFVKLGDQHSTDRASQRNQGSLGWFGKGRMVKPFEDAAFAARKGQLLGPIKTQFGYHIIEILDRSDREAKIADIAYNIEAGPATIREQETKADDFRYFTEENGWTAEIEKNADISSTNVAIQPDMQFIPGIGNSRTLLDFLEKSNSGDVSDVIELNDNYVVAYVNSITEEGYRPFEEVQEELRPRVALSLKKGIQAKKLKDAISSGSDLDAIALAVSGIKRTASQVSYDNTLIPNLGREPKIVGAALGLPENGLSGVVEGENSVVVLQVQRRYEPSIESLTDAKRSELKKQLLQKKQQAVTSKWLSELKDNAVINDNRRTFIQ